MVLDLAASNMRAPFLSFKTYLMQKIYIGNGSYLNIPYVKPTKTEIRDALIFNNLAY